MPAEAVRPFADVYFSAQDGLKLHVQAYGPERDATPVVCLPGLTRNARDFHDLALFLSAQAATPRRVVAFDLRGRGRSAYDPDWTNYNTVVEAGDVLAGLTALGIERAHFVGTSRGGLIVHLLAGMRPAAIRNVVLNDVGPVLEGEGLAQIRAYLERSPKPETFEDALRIQREIHGSAFPALGDEDWRRHTAAIYREEAGKPVADFDPALMKTIAALDLNQPLPVLWAQFAGLCAVPMLAIRGGTSKLLSRATLEEMALRHPRFEAITVEGQGHAPLLGTGDLPQRISAFLDRA